MPQIGPFPLILLGEAYWERLRDFVWDQLDAGAIAIEDVGFARLLDSPEEAVEIIVEPSRQRFEHVSSRARPELALSC